jgi:hypothetical protein
MKRGTMNYEDVLGVLFSAARSASERIYKDESNGDDDMGETI